MSPIFDRSIQIAQVAADLLRSLGLAGAALAQILLVWRRLRRVARPARPERALATIPEMEWKRVHITAEGPPTVLEIDGVGVVRMIDRLDGSWFAVLDYHLAEDRRRIRDCSSYEAGRRGAEQWAQRHLERLQREAAACRAQWARLPVAVGTIGPQRSWEELEAERARLIEELRVPPRRPRRRR